MKSIALSVLIAITAYPVSAEGLKSLENFVKTVKTGQASFTQVVSAPPKVGSAGQAAPVARSKTSSGSFAFQRPNRFSFIYQKPFAQSIVADGKTLWLYDVDLNQVTARAQAQALDATPAALIASAPNLQALRADFTLQAAADQDGLEWVLATPKTKDGQLQSVRIGFSPAGVLAALEILDSFGQHSLLRFTQFEANPVLAADTFVFTPPATADLLRP